jgi:hypothetical protein
MAGVDRLDKWQRLDEELEFTMRRPICELEAMQSKMTQSEGEVVALENMCKIAIRELKGCPSDTPACDDVLEHCVRAIVDIKRIHLETTIKLDGTRRFVASAVLEHHDSIMPYMSDEEVRILHEYSPFVVR